MNDLEKAKQILGDINNLLKVLQNNLNKAEEVGNLGFVWIFNDLKKMSTMSGMMPYDPKFKLFWEALAIYCLHETNIRILILEVNDEKDFDIVVFGKGNEKEIYELYDKEK